jgi:hypothetical protein
VVYPDLKKIHEDGGEWVETESLLHKGVPNVINSADLNEGHTLMGGPLASTGSTLADHTSTTSVPGLQGGSFWKNAWHSFTNTVGNVGRAVAHAGEAALDGVKGVVSTGIHAFNDAKGAVEKVVDMIPAPIRDAVTNYVLPAVAPELYAADQVYDAATGDDPIADITDTNGDENPPASPPPSSPAPPSPPPTSSRPAVRPSNKISISQLTNAARSMIPQSFYPSSYAQQVHSYAQQYYPTPLTQQLGMTGYLPSPSMYAPPPPPVYNPYGYNPYMRMY